MLTINFTNGTKFVPTNSTYWEGYCERRKRL